MRRNEKVSALAFDVMKYSRNALMVYLWSMDRSLSMLQPLKYTGTLAVHDKCYAAISFSCKTIQARKGACIRSIRRQL